MTLEEINAVVRLVGLPADTIASLKEQTPPPDQEVLLTLRAQLPGADEPFVVNVLMPGEITTVRFDMTLRAALERISLERARREDSKFAYKAPI